MLRTYDVFISSTFIDNKERRALVQDAVILVGLHPVGMERFTASVRPTAEQCIQMAREADVLVGIIGWRYGWEPPGYDRSITELEYDAASERLMFLIDESLSPSGDGDLDEEPDNAHKQAQLAAFKARIRNDQMAASFTDARLQLLIFEALRQWKEHKDGVTSDQSRGDGAGIVSGDPSPEHGLPSRHNMPMARPHGAGFVGRELALGMILDQLRAGRECDLSDVGVLVLSGIPGTGKSTLASELAYRIGRQFPGGVFWFDARATTTMESHANAVGKLIPGIPPSLCSESDQASKDTLAAAVRDYFESQPCLVIFDAFSVESGALMKLMPKTGLTRVILTIRADRPDLPAKTTVIPVPSLDLRSATEVLTQLRISPPDSDERQTVEDICIELGCLPLALQLAARYLGAHSLSFAEYLARLRARGPKWKGLASTIQTLPTMIEVLKQCIEDFDSRGPTGELAKKILRRCAAIDLTHDKLHRWDLKKASNEVEPLGLATAVGINRDDEDAVGRFDDAINLLVRTGLMRLIPGSHIDVWVHALTLQFARDYLDEEDARYVAFRLGASWSQSLALMCHLGVWLDYWSEAHKAAKSALPVLKRLCPDAALAVLNTLYEMAEFHSDPVAEEILNEAIDLATTHNVDSSRSILIMGLRISKAYTVYKAKRFGEAEVVYDQLENELKTNPAPVDELSDFLYYFGCLLLQLGGDQKRERTRKLWEQAIENLMEILPLMEQRPAPPQVVFALKLRLCRLFHARSEKFPELSKSSSEATMESSLSAELNPYLQNPESLNGQFLSARSPVHIKLRALAVW